MSLLLRSYLKLEGLLFRQYFDRLTKDPLVSQRRYLMDVLKKNSKTLYGKEHGFSSITSEKDYRSNVPVNQYHDLEPYINKIANGQQNILTACATSMFNLTSGTSDKPKYIPVTLRTKKCTLRLNHQWLYRSLLDHPDFLDKSNLTITGAAVEGYTPASIPFGSVSGLIYKNLARPIRNCFVLPSIVSEIKNYELRYYVMSRLAIESDVSFAATPNPTTLLKLAEVGIAHQQEIIRSICDGRLMIGTDIIIGNDEKKIVKALEHKLKPNPSRARFLESVLLEKGRLTPQHCWPSLKLIACWLGGSSGYQADKLASYYGDVAQRDLGYLASEGCMTLPVSDKTPAGVLALPNNYYEFIPQESDDTSVPVVVGCHELEVGKHYKVLLTNESGLYRYDINDIVKLEDFYNRTPVLSFVRKTDNILNITGEKVHVNQLTMAFQEIKSRHNIEISIFRVAANQQMIRYDMMVVVDNYTPEKLVNSSIIRAIDSYLSTLNIEYEQKRRSGRLNPPCLYVMDKTWPEAVKRAAIESGKRDIQYKWECLAPEMTDIDKSHIEHTVEPRE